MRESAILSLIVVALTLDMNEGSTTDYVIPKIDLDIVDADCVVNLLTIEKEASIFSSIVDQVSSLEYDKEMCKNVHEALLLDLADLVDSIKSALATTFVLKAFLMEIMATFLVSLSPNFG